jgi:hypothetical protein
MKRLLLVLLLATAAFGQQCENVHSNTGMTCLLKVSSVEAMLAQVQYQDTVACLLSHGVPLGTMAMSSVTGMNTPSFTYPGTTMPDTTAMDVINSPNAFANDLHRNKVMVADPGYWACPVIDHTPPPPPPAKVTLTCAVGIVLHAPWGDYYDNAGPLPAATGETCTDPRGTFLSVIYPSPFGTVAYWIMSKAFVPPPPPSILGPAISGPVLAPVVVDDPVIKQPGKVKVKKSKKK